MFFKKNIDSLDAEFSEQEIDQLYQTGRGLIDAQLKEFIGTQSHDDGNEDLWDRWSQIRNMLFHLNERVNYWEGRRTQFLQIGIGLLAGSLAGMLAIVSKSSEVAGIVEDGMIEPSLIFLTIEGIGYTFALVICFCFALGCLRLLDIWNSQNNPSYPFTKAYRTWVWHYRHAEKTSVDTNYTSYTAQSFRKQVEAFSKNLVDYKKRLLGCDVAELLDQDISQVYVLLINEKFKIKMVSMLRDCLLKTTRFSLYLGSIAVIALSLARLMLLVWSA